MVSRAAFLKSVPRRSRNWIVSNAEKHRKFLRAEEFKRTAPVLGSQNRHRYQMVRGQMNGPTERASKNTIRLDVTFVSFSRVGYSRRDVTANQDSTSDPTTIGVLPLKRILVFL